MQFNRDAPGAKLVLEIDAITHGEPLNLDNLDANTHKNEKRANNKQREGGSRKNPEQTWRLIIGKQADVKAPGSWIEHAACKGKGDIMCYGAINVLVERPIRFQQQTERAIAICMKCPVIVQCRQWAMTVPDPAIDHVAGGLTPWERRDMRRKHLKAT